MKCYKCNGTGYYDVDNECPVCDGTGEYEPFDTDVELDKLYTTEQTNEEWFCQLPTEEKAKELQLTYISGRTDEFFDKPQKMVQNFIQWLKQPHNREVK